MRGHSRSLFELRRARLSRGNGARFDRIFHPFSGPGTARRTGDTGQSWNRKRKAQRGDPRRPFAILRLESVTSALFALRQTVQDGQRALQRLQVVSDGRLVHRYGSSFETDDPTFGVGSSSAHASMGRSDEAFERSADAASKPLASAALAPIQGGRRLASMPGAPCLIIYQ